MRAERRHHEARMKSRWRKWARQWLGLYETRGHRGHRSAQGAPPEVPVSALQT